MGEVSSRTCERDSPKIASLLAAIGCSISRPTPSATRRRLRGSRTLPWIAVAASRPPVSTQRPAGGVLLLSQVAMLD
jgi:hypothetical protein